MGVYVVNVSWKKKVVKGWKNKEKDIDLER
jgi:hypothetical protein